MSKPTSRLVSSEVEKMNENTKLLPVVKLDGREFLVDIESREFIDTGDLSYCISMYSRKGHAMVNAMEGREWNCFAVYPRDGMEV